MANQTYIGWNHGRVRQEADPEKRWTRLWLAPAARVSTSPGAGSKGPRSPASWPAAQLLAAAEGQLADLERRERSGAAREELSAARQKLIRARELYDRGTPGYDQPLSEARDSLFYAELAISRADSRATLGRALEVFFFTFLGAALLGTGFVLNRRRRGVRREAEQLLAAWRNALDEKLGALLDELEQRVARFVGPASGEGQRPWSGETLVWAGQIRADVGSLYILWTSANNVLQQAEALIRASGPSEIAARAGPV